MGLGTRLQSVSELISSASPAVTNAIELTLSSGPLRDMLLDLCKVGGVAGAMFALGARYLPKPSTEQRIAAELHRAFIVSLNQELSRHSWWLDENRLRDYSNGPRFREIAEQRLSESFTWLQVSSGSGVIPSRSWPIVGTLADVARAWLVDMGASCRLPESELQQLADDTRGEIHRSLCSTVDKFMADPEIERAVAEMIPSATRNALELLAERISVLDHYRLFDDIPQSALYVPPSATLIDLAASGPEGGEISLDSEDRICDTILAKHPCLIVIAGGMGVGKSCLMRVLAARLARRYLSDQRYPPVLVRWRDIYGRDDLPMAIAERLEEEYSLPLHDLPDQRDVLYLVDGFDEMRSHEEGYIVDRFDRLLQLRAHGCSLVVTMRSTVITRTLHNTWLDRKAKVIEVRGFGKKGLTMWADKWRMYTGASAVNPQSLSSLAASALDSTHALTTNPLLLYMLAKYIYPMSTSNGREMGRTKIFRAFVDETIRGKLRASRGEDFPIDFNDRHYRYLLQEMAFIASWPVHNSKCMSGSIQDLLGDPTVRNLKLPAVRTAFVLHFFSPVAGEQDEFEFHPEGFRQYLLAEWCARSLMDSVMEHRHFLHPFDRSADDSANGLAQFPLVDDERELLSEVYEDLGRLARGTSSELCHRLNSLGTVCDAAEAVKWVQGVYSCLRQRVDSPSLCDLLDRGVGVPKGQEVPEALEPVRLILNYLDHCLMATFGLYRGLGRNPKQEAVFTADRAALQRFMGLARAVRGRSWRIGMKLSRLGLRGVDLGHLSLPEVDFSFSDLSEADLAKTELNNADFTYASLVGASLTSANLTEARLPHANLTRADLCWSNLTGADLTGAKLTGANIRGAHMRWAVLERADLRGASMNPKELRVTYGTPDYLPDGTRPDGRYRDAHQKRPR